MLLFELATRLRLATPTSCVFVPTVAWAVSAAMFSAIEAPAPTLELPAALFMDWAVAVLVERSLAERVTLAPPTVTEEPFWISASYPSLVWLTARLPATPIPELLPAPEIAWALKLLGARAFA